MSPLPIVLEKNYNLNRPVDSDFEICYRYIRRRQDKLLAHIAQINAIRESNARLDEKLNRLLEESRVERESLRKSLKSIREFGKLIRDSTEELSRYSSRRKVKKC